MDEEKIDVFFETILSSINNVRQSIHYPEVNDFRAFDLPNSDAIYRETFIITEECKHNANDEKARAAVMKKFTTLLQEQGEENDFQALVLTRAATHIDLTFSHEDHEATLSLSVYFAYLVLSDISPVIDGTGVVQGMLLTNDLGPVLCVVSFAADDEEEFRQVAMIPPWDMMVHAVEKPDDAQGDDDNTMGFTIPLDLAAFNLGEGSVEIRVYVDRLATISYSDIDPNFEFSAALYTSSLKWETRCIMQDGANDSLSTEDRLMVDTNDVAQDDDGAAEAIDAIEAQLDELPTFLVVQEVRIAMDYDELMQARDDGFTACCEAIDSETGEVVIDQEHLWKFHICTKLGPAEQGGVEDIVFLKTQKSLGSLPTLKDYTVFHDTDLTEIEDNFSCYLAVKFGPHPKFVKVTQLSANTKSAKAVGQLHEYSELNGCLYRPATEDIVQHVGGNCGLALKYYNADAFSPGGSPLKAAESSTPSKHGKGHHHGHNHHSHHKDNDSVSTQSATQPGSEAKGGSRANSSDSDESDGEYVEEDTLMERFEKLRREKEEQISTNQDLQKRCVALMLKEKSLQIQNSGAQATKTPAGTPANIPLEDANPEAVSEKEKQFTDMLTHITEHRRKLRMQEEEFDLLAHDLQTRLDDKEYKSAEISSNFKDFKREILSRAVNSRSGKLISKRLIAQFELVEKKREETLEQVRLKNIAMKNTLKKLERQLEAREHLAEGLHMIDFEQLKIENQSLSEKIEERTEELIKLKRKKSCSVQMLTHVREKLVFVEKQNKLYSEELGECEQQIIDMRGVLTQMKNERERTRKENHALQQRQGFATSEDLIVDFEKTKVNVDSIQGEIRDLKQRYQVMARKLGMPLDEKTGFVASPMRHSQSALSVQVPFHTGVGRSGSMNSLNMSQELFSPNRLSPLRRGSPVANNRRNQREQSFPMVTMTPMRNTASTGSSYMKKLPPLMSPSK